MAEVITNRKVGTDYYFLELSDDHIDENWQPGRFLHLKVSRDKAYDPLLRRPFSLFDVNPQKGTFSLLYCVVGRGTRILTDFGPGEKIDYLGPLGHGFFLPEGKEIIVIGGGMGTAPLFYLCRKLTLRNRVTLLLGGNICTDVEFFQNKFGALDLDIELATMDGSIGLGGTVIDLWNDLYVDDKHDGDLKKDFDYLYACGPEPMLAEVQKLAQKYEIEGEISLEERMGCGIGVCLSCVCDTREGNQRVCKEGPVFNLDEVIFDE